MNLMLFPVFFCLIVSISVDAAKCGSSDKIVLDPKGCSGGMQSTILTTTVLWKWILTCADMLAESRGLREEAEKRFKGRYEPVANRLSIWATIYKPEGCYIGGCRIYHILTRMVELYPVKQH